PGDPGFPPPPADERRRGVLRRGGGSGGPRAQLRPPTRGLLRGVPRRGPRRPAVSRAPTRRAGGRHGVGRSDAARAGHLPARPPRAAGSVGVGAGARKLADGRSPRSPGASAGSNGIARGRRQPPATQSLTVHQVSDCAKGRSCRPPPRQQDGRTVGKLVPATFPFQQLSVPVPSQARSTANTGLIRGEGSLPFPVARLKRMRLKSGLGSMSSSAQSAGEMGGFWARQKFATAMPKEVLPVTIL